MPPQTDLLEAEKLLMDVSDMFYSSARGNKFFLI